ncbi:MAG: ATP-binding protein [Syntrophobacteraceae bacterium]
MEDSALHILLIEDKPADYELIKGLLSMAPRSKFSMDWVENCESAVQEIEQKHYDACLVAGSFEGPEGQSIMKRVLSAGLPAPVIFVTAQRDQEVDLSAIQAGAADYLVIDQVTPDHLDRSIRYAIERKRAEESLRRSEAQLKCLSSQLLSVHETERKRVSLELHDSLGQILSAVKYGVESTLAHMERGTVKPGTLEPLVPMIQHAIQEVRRIYTALRPTLLDDLGILATLNWYCREFSNLHPQLEVEKQIAIDESIIPEPTKIIIYRLVQDGFENVATHSRATRVTLSLQQAEKRIQLRIEDNGVGFRQDWMQSANGNPTGLGLPSMKERTELSGGTFHCESEPGKGTKLTASWPCP